MAGLGATHYNWRPDVRRVVASVLEEFPRVTANTYVDHPFPGWDNRSADFWGSGGRGDPIPKEVGFAVRRYINNLSMGPRVRHSIYLHQWWTDWSGMQTWKPNDHSGALRHVHFTWY